MGKIIQTIKKNFKILIKNKISLFILFFRPNFNYITYGFLLL